MCSIEFLIILNYPAITNIFAINQIIRYNGVFATINEDPATTNIFFGTVALRYSGVQLYIKSEKVPSHQLNSKTNDLVL